MNLKTRYSGLNTNKERREFWQKLSEEKGNAWLLEALSAIDANSNKVLRCHYFENQSLKSVTSLLHRSISTVRNYHNRGVFDIQQYYFTQIS